MPLFAIPFPAIDPVAIAVGPFVVRWYALAYIAGLLIGWRYCLFLADRPPRLVTRRDVDDFLVWATLGVVLGGRLGYVLFYNFAEYAKHPIEALYLWHGGMSFHGGAIGVTLAIVLFARRRAISMFAFADIICAAVPIGLFFGRIANFINGELFGRITDVPWAIVFPGAGPWHPDGTSPRRRADGRSAWPISPRGSPGGSAAKDRCRLPLSWRSRCTIPSPGITPGVFRWGAPAISSPRRRSARSSASWSD